MYNGYQKIYMEDLESLEATFKDLRGNDNLMNEAITLLCGDF